MNDVNWTDFAIVIGLVGGLSALAYLDAMRAARRAARHQQLVDDAAEVESGAQR